MEYDGPMEILKVWRRRVTLVIGLAVVVMVVMHLNSRMLEKVQLQGERDAVLVRVEELQAIEAELDRQIAYAISDDIVDQWAREQNWMQREGDFVIALLGNGEPPPHEMTELYEPEPDLNHWDSWRLWLTFRE